MRKKGLRHRLMQLSGRHKRVSEIRRNMSGRVNTDNQKSQIFTSGTAVTRGPGTRGESTWRLSKTELLGHDKSRERRVREIS